MPSFDSRCIWEMSYLWLRMGTQLLWGLCPAVLESAISPTPFLLRDPSSNAMRHGTSFFHIAIKSMRLNGTAKFKKGQLDHCGYLLFSEAHKYLVRIFYNFTTFFGMRNQKHNVHQVKRCMAEEIWLRKEIWVRLLVGWRPSGPGEGKPNKGL